MFSHKHIHIPKNNDNRFQRFCRGTFLNAAPRAPKRTNLGGKLFPRLKSFIRGWTYLQSS